MSIPSPLNGATDGGAMAVRVHGVSHHFGEGEARTPVLVDNHLDLAPGEIVVMTGKSGSGKTTLLTLIGALRRLQEGSLEVLGRELSGLDEAQLVEVRKVIGFIFQAHNLFGSLSAYQNVRMALELHDCPRDQMRSRATEMLLRIIPDLGKKIDNKPARLSGGQRQRVAIARALVNHPRLVLADEPTAALDEESGLLVMRLFREMSQLHGSTILIVTHDEKILEYTDRIVRMSYGRIAFNVRIEEYLAVCKILKRHETFSNLSPDSLAEVAGKMHARSYPPGAVVIRQGELGDTFYLIKSGEVDVLVDKGEGDHRVRSMGPGEFFGEAALILDKPRGATIVARGPLDVYALDKEDFKAAVAASKNVEAQLRSLIFQRS